MPPIIDDRTTDASSESPCTEVRNLLSSFVDGRATLAEEQFVRTHLPKCPGCASELAFQKAMKAAWAKTPVAVPPASLSARIAAATYRKPTFAERFLAFLQPAPVRVAIGVAAVAGIAYFSLPRVQAPEIMSQPVHLNPARVVAENDTIKPAPVKQAPKVERPVGTVAKNNVSKPVVKHEPVIKPTAPIVEEPTVAVAPTPERVVVKPAPQLEVKKIIPPVQKHTTQVALVTPKHVPHVPAPTESVTTTPDPKMNPDNTSEVAVATPVAPVEKPQTKEPPAIKSVENTVFAVAGEDKPGFRSANAGKIGSRIASGTASFVANNTPVASIVSAPAKF